VASVSRCVARALDEEIRAGRLERADRVLLLDPADARGAAPARGCVLRAHGRQPLFALQLWGALWLRRPELVFLDLVGLARALDLPLPGRPRRYAIFCHGVELGRVEPGSRRERAVVGAWRLLANSEYTARSLRERFPRAAERVRVVTLCIDPERTGIWSHSEPAAPPPREPAALIVGRLWSEERGKGHDELLDAWRGVRERVPRAQLWVVGDGDDRPRLERRAREQGLADAVRFLGHVSDAELGDVFRRASLFAMPSRQEGFGLVYAEAMWHGLPCIVSSADAGAEVVRAGQTGLVVPYGDAQALRAAVVELLSDPERCRRLGEAGRREARERFGFPRFRADLLRALELAPG
jgi:phosphatidylinositol alpha-1,6-mannosyltransferase